MSLQHPGTYNAKEPFMQYAARTILGLSLCLLMAGSVSAATINITVSTDKSSYDPGETVQWDIVLSTSTGDNAGISALSVDLDDSTGEALASADTLGSEFAGFYAPYPYGNPAATPPRLRGLGIIAFSKSPAVVNKGNDGNDHLYFSGEYTVSVPGEHTLEVLYTQGGPSYWATDNLSVVDSTSFETVNATDATFTVTPEPATLGLLAVGGSVMLLRRRRK